MLEKNFYIFLRFQRKSGTVFEQIIDYFLNREKDFCKYHCNYNDICNANIYYQHNILFNIS